MGWLSNCQDRHGSGVRVGYAIEGKPSFSSSHHVSKAENLASLQNDTQQEELRDVRRTTEVFQ